jgi:hypothetical protein
VEFISNDITQRAQQIIVGVIMSIAEQVSLAEGSAHKTTEIKRIVASSVIGTAVEWYDFLIYGKLVEDQRACRCTMRRASVRCSSIR